MNMANTQNSDFYEDMLNKYQKLNRSTLQSVLNSKTGKVERGRYTYAYKKAKEDQITNHQNKNLSFPRKEGIKHLHEGSKSRSRSNKYDMHDLISGSESRSQTQSPKSNLKPKYISKKEAKSPPEKANKTSGESIIRISKSNKDPITANSLVGANANTNQTDNIKPIKDEDKILAAQLASDKKVGKFNLFKKLKRPKEEDKGSIIAKIMASDKSAITFNISDKIIEGNKIILNAIIKRKAALIEIQKKKSSDSKSKSAHSIKSKSLNNMKNESRESENDTNRARVFCCF